MDASRGPVVSIVLTTYNRPELLQRAMNSALTQTYGDFELLVVDDCSPGDATEKTVKAFSDSRVRYMRLAKNGGSSVARNSGIRQARGSYIGFLDDDDHWTADKLEKQLAVFERGGPKLGAVGCGRIDHLGGADEIHIPRFRGNIFKDILARRARGYAAPLILVKRFSQEPDYLFNENLPALEDLEYCLRIARRRTLDFVPEPLVHVHRDENRPHVWNSENALAGYKWLLKNYESDITSDPEVLRFYLFAMGRESGRLGRHSEARRYFRDAARAHSGNWRLPLWYLATFAGRFGNRVAERLVPIASPQSSVEDEATAPAAPLLEKEKGQVV